MTRTCLYLATFDPTVTVTGTTLRGRAFLRFLSRRYRTHAVYLRDPDEIGRPPQPLPDVASMVPISCGKWSYFLYCRALARAARAVLERDPPDFIFADFEKAGWYARRLARRFGTPFVYNSHNVEYRRYLDTARANALRYLFVPYLYVAERVACRHAILTIAISETDAVAFREWVASERLVVRPCAFDEDQIHPHYDERLAERPTVLFVGNYRNTGNRDAVYLILDRILPQVVERRPETVFRFVGNGFPDDVHHPNVEAAGYVPDLLGEYARAHIVIAPITMGGGIKIKVIEALATGKPLIATAKAMEGIPACGWSNLRVAPLEDFSDLITHLLEARPTKTLANWKRVSKEFGIRQQLVELGDRIDVELDRLSDSCHTRGSSSSCATTLLSLAG